MGKSRGRGGGKRPGGRKGFGDMEDVSEAPNLGGQPATAGMLPPSDSESESEEESPQKEARPVGGQSATAGMMPPSSSDEDSDEEEGEKEKEKKPKVGKALAYGGDDEPKKKSKKEMEEEAEQAAVDMERLALIKKRREEQRLKRIADEGWDRFAPVSETNKPPGHDAALLAKQG